jgi:hypothetical protein
LDARLDDGRSGGRYGREGLWIGGRRRHVEGCLGASVTRFFLNHGGLLDIGAPKIGDAMPGGLAAEGDLRRNEQRTNDEERCDERDDEVLFGARVQRVIR